MDIQSAYKEAGTLRGAAAICGTTHKTVKRILEAAERAEAGVAVKQERNFDGVRGVVAEKIDTCQGRISAKRLLPLARAAGYEGSPRNFRRLVAEEKAAWKQARRTNRRPVNWAPGDAVVFDWGQVGKLYVFCAVLAYSRVRFVRFTDNLGQVATLQALAACFEYLGGVPKLALTDRMGCLVASQVAGVVVPVAEYVRMATHYRFRPDFCLAADPESKGLVENLVGYVKSDLIHPQCLSVKDLALANEKAAHWMSEVNNNLHSEIQEVPLVRLTREREVLSALPALRIEIAKREWRKVDKLSCVRFGSARYSVPTSLVGQRVEVRVADGGIEIHHGGAPVATHEVVPPGEVSVKDEHYGGPRPPLARAPRPKSKTEVAFAELGPVATEFISAAAAAGSASLSADLTEMVEMIPIYGSAAMVSALKRAIAFSRFRAADVRSIILAGAGAHQPATPGAPIPMAVPPVPLRPLSAYAIPEGR